MPTLNPFCSVRYSDKNQKNLGVLAVSDLDTAENLWGTADSTLSFRNLLVGSVEQRSQIWQAWLSSRELEFHDDPAFYVLRQEFTGKGGKIAARWAVYGSTDVMAGKILVHENVFPEGVERARQATEACEGDIAPIFASMDDKEGNELRKCLIKLCEGKDPLVRYRDTAGLEVALWKVDSKANVLAIQKVVGEGNLFLLDGHHRLAAAKENLKAGLGDGRILVCVCSMDEEDILIYPMHRLVFCERWMLPGSMVEDLVHAGCTLKPVVGRSPGDLDSVLAEISKKDKAAAVLLHAHDDRMHIVTFSTKSGLPDVLRELPVAHLDLEILKEIKCSVIPAADFRMAMEQLAQDQVQVAFFLPAVKQDQVRRAAREGITLPRKSTRFVPKPPIGLVCRPWSF